MSLVPRSDKIDTSLDLIARHGLKLERDCFLASFMVPMRLRNTRRLKLIRKGWFWDSSIDEIQVPVYNPNPLTKRERFQNFFRPLVGKSKVKPHESYEQAQKKWRVNSKQ